VTPTKREKTIAIAAAAALLSYLGYTYAVTPYLSLRNELQLSIKGTMDRYTQERKLLKNQAQVAADWKALLATNVRTTPADALSKTQDALFDWARSAGLNLQAVKPERPTQQGDFQLIHLTASGEGSESSVARWLWSIESSNLPLQIEEFRVTARKDGTDDLSLQVSMTAMVFSPPPPSRTAVKPKPAPTGDVP
jgi:hypothetical protein